MKQLLLPAVLVFTSCGGILSFAATTQPSHPGQHANPRADSQVVEISAMLTSGDEAEINRGLEMIRERFAKKPAETAQEFEQSWVGALVQARQLGPAAELCLQGILEKPWDLHLVESLQQRRVEVLLAMGRTNEALQAAKGLYNVCQMKNTASAINVLGDALLAAWPDDKKKVDRLRAEQIAGADFGEDSGSRDPVATTEPSTQPAVLASITIDDKPYAAAIAKREGRNAYVSLFAKGNLLLLAGDPTRALQAFREAYPLSNNSQLAEATESIARAMRARDGSVGRANAWLTSLDPSHKK